MERKIIVQALKRSFSTQSADCEYACGLGPMAAAIADVDTSDCEFIRPKPIRGWRDWGFRTYRVSRYLEAYDAERAALENPGN
ncbi:MAG: hypothetical protein GKR99_17340 [Rhodobacteraceae bacterium]|nr:hypothetical protein [Paracoccaceae bacterium]